MSDHPDQQNDPRGEPSLPELPWAARPTDGDADRAPSGSVFSPTMERQEIARARLLRSRDGRAGRVVGRVFRVVFVLGLGVVLLATVGRSLVFPDQWTAEIAPYVDELQAEYEVAFEESLEFVELSEGQYAEQVAQVMLGPGWTDRLPEWRALGLVGGRVRPEQIASIVAARYPAHFDPASRSLVASRVVEPADREVALRLALRVALADQVAQGERPTRHLLGLTGVDRLDELGWWSLDEALAGPGFEFFEDPTLVPLPVAYLLRAPSRIGRSLIGAAGDVSPGTAPASKLARLDDGATMSLEPVPVLGDEVILDTTPLGPDDWAMVLGSRLDPRLTLLMVDLMAADTYSVVSRGDSTCVVAIIEGVDAAATEVLAAGLVAWAESAPPDTATVVQLDAVRLRLDACDPGAAALSPPLTAAEVVIGRQLARLSG